MKLAAPLVIMVTLLNPPDYRTLQLGGVVPRFYSLQMLFTPKQVLFDNPLIRLIRIIRKLLIHLLANQQPLRFLPSRLYLGKMLSTNLSGLTFVLTLLIFIIFIFRSKPKPSKKAKLSKTAVDNTTPEPAENPEPFEDNAEIPHDDPPPMDHDVFVD